MFESLGMPLYARQAAEKLRAFEPVSLVARAAGSTLTLPAVAGSLAINR
jgi:hypothetical protein